MPTDSVFFRVDANFKIGMGHAKRCFIIAQEILKHSNAKVFFLSENLPDEFQLELKSRGIEVFTKDNRYKSEIEFIGAAVSNRGKSTLLIDSYKPVFYPGEFQKELLKHVNVLAYIVFENTQYTYYTHVLHNQNPLSAISDYKTQAYTKCLFGLENVVLDETFRDIARNYTNNFNKKQKYISLLSFGGSDPNNLTAKVLKSLSLINSFFDKHIVVLGGMYQFEDSLREYIATSGLEIELHKNVKSMHELMMRCDIGFVSGGITNWELGSLGKPLIIFPAGEKEFLSAEFLHNAGWAQVIEQPVSTDEKELALKIKHALSKDLKKMSDELKAQINVDGINNLVRSLII